jgi:hypothetical protein
LKNAPKVISLSLEGGLAPARLEGDRVRLAILRFWRDIAYQQVTEIGLRPAILRRVYRPPVHRPQ